MTKIRTRYAPSPTGFFHVGGARTALFNYLYAKHNNGDFIVRIEDTDTERNVVGGVESQLNNLDWLNIKYDESVRNPGKYFPYVQSEKLGRYKKLAYELVEQKKAYFCFCSKADLDKNRFNSKIDGTTPKYNRHCLNLSQEEINEKIKNKIPYVIRLKIQDNIEISWNDMIRGKISFPTSALTDPVILKSNGVAMYNFAVVVDDYDMDITNVIRGEEHISNTPYQIAIKQALGFDSKNIEYGHLSVIVNETGKKLSKRDMTLKQFIEDYRIMGFIPQAIVNFLCLLGWSPADKKEIMTLSESIKLFDINHVSKAPSFFDYKKMLWMGNEYFKQMTDEAYLKFVKQFIKIDFLDYRNDMDQILLLFKLQISYAQQLNELIQSNFFNNEKLTIENVAFLKSDSSLKTILALKKIMENFSDKFDFEEAKKIVNEVKLITKNNGKDLYMPIRIILTNCEHGPELNKILSIIGKTRILDLIKKSKIV